jgi:hypothetical protein
MIRPAPQDERKAALSNQIGKEAWQGGIEAEDNFGIL